MNRSQRKLQLVPNREINFSTGSFARHLSSSNRMWPSLITQIILFRHSHVAHHLVTCASDRRALREGINICHEWDFFLPDFPLEKTAHGCCFSLHFRLGFLPAKASRMCAPLCLAWREERLVTFLQEFAIWRFDVRTHICSATKTRMEF